MPIPTVSREPGRIEAQNGADFSGAQPCHQTVEAGARHRSARRPAKIVVDDFDIHETVLAGDRVQVIICDQRMPGESGVDFLRRARDLWPDPVRMIISGFT